MLTTLIQIQIISIVDIIMYLLLSCIYWYHVEIITI